MYIQVWSCTFRATSWAAFKSNLKQRTPDLFTCQKTNQNSRHLPWVLFCTIRLATACILHSKLLFLLSQKSSFGEITENLSFHVLTPTQFCLQLLHGTLLFCLSNLHLLEKIANKTLSFHVLENATINACLFSNGKLIHPAYVSHTLFKACALHSAKHVLH
mmetsp:Transcript_50270/g.98547  ORF Transcript_50270/g.98547 Transcript_50270/m.98547 type:complete len:161 (-) Transcript_50270:144-626(-)